jgi:hypothetical protein
MKNQAINWVKIKKIFHFSVAKDSLIKNSRTNMKTRKYKQMKNNKNNKAIF